MAKRSRKTKTKTEPARIFAGRVEEMRNRQRRSQQGLADTVNAISGWSWHQTTVAKVESGKRGVDIKEMFVLALALGVSPVWLFLPGEQDRGKVRIGEQDFDRGVYVSWLRGNEDLSGYDAIELAVARSRAVGTLGSIPDADLILYEKGER